MSPIIEGPPPQLIDPKLRFPGTWVDRTAVEEDARRELDTIAHGLSNLTKEAAVAFFLFVDANKKALPDPMAWAPRSQRVIAAKAFMYSVYHIRSHAARAAVHLPELAAPLAVFDEFLPHLTPARNSAAHSDERLLGLKTGGKPIAVQPVDIPGFIVGGGSALIVDSFFNDTYTATAADGSVSSVPITFDAFTASKTLAQQVIEATPWTGPPCVR